MSDQPLYPPRSETSPSAGAPYGNQPSGIPSYAPPLDLDPTPAPPPSGGSDVDTDSTADVAKTQAADVAGGAKDAAKDVADTAKEQVGEVAQEARTQIKQVVGQARTELTEQAHAQQKKVASGLSSLAQQLSAMADGSDQPGPATDVARQAADKAQEFAGWLENRDPQGVLDEVRSFARRKPGVFLLAAVGAGIAAGRLARGLSADPDPSPTTATADANRVSSPTPTGIGGARHDQLPAELTAPQPWERPGGGL